MWADIVFGGLADIAAEVCPISDEAVPVTFLKAGYVIACVLAAKQSIYDSGIETVACSYRADCPDFS